MPTILPTQTCFDDALDYLSEAVREDPSWALGHLRLVHGICLAPEGQYAGELFAHAWVEEDRRVCIQAGILDGRKGYYGISRAQHYALLRVQLTTVYTVEEALEKNLASNHYGPWESSYQSLCGDRVFWP